MTGPMPGFQQALPWYLQTPGRDAINPLMPGPAPGGMSQAPQPSQPFPPFGQLLPQMPAQPPELMRDPGAGPPLDPQAPDPGQELRRGTAYGSPLFQGQTERRKALLFELLDALGRPKRRY